MRYKRTPSGRRTWRRLLAVSIFTLLAACGRFGGENAPVGKARPGADRQIAPTGTLPAANPGRQTERTVVSGDDLRGTTPPIGSVVTTKGAANNRVEPKQTAPPPATPSE